MVIAEQIQFLIELLLEQCLLQGYLLLELSLAHLEVLFSLFLSLECLEPFRENALEYPEVFPRLDPCVAELLQFLLDDGLGGLAHGP